MGTPEQNQTTAREGALTGVRVVDMTQLMAGPFCAMQLCDMGAHVIKVESPTGDSTRRMAGASGTDSPAFNAVNRGKRGVVFNLKTALGREAFRRLATRSDILIENYRPGVMREFGLDYETLSAQHPGLIYASISGFGQTGPYADKGGFDLVAQGMSGLMSITGEPGGAPVKVGVPITDLGAGLFALAAILAALHYRSRTGRGQYIDTSLLEAGVALSVWEATEFFASGRIPQPLGSAHRMSAPYQAVRCADGYMNLAAANDRLFVRLCGLLGHPEWATHPDYLTDTRRVANKVALATLIETQTTRHPRAHWEALLSAHDIPCGPINTYDQVFDDPQVRARGMVAETVHPTLGSMRVLGSALKLSETPPCVTRRAPLLGEHTVEVLQSLGFPADEIAQMRVREGPGPVGT